MPAVCLGSLGVQGQLMCEQIATAGTGVIRDECARHSGCTQEMCGGCATEVSRKQLSASGGFSVSGTEGT